MGLILLNYTFEGFLSDYLIQKNPALAEFSFGHCQWICCWPDDVGCDAAGTTIPGDTIKRSTVSVVTNVALQLMFVHW